MAHQHTHEHSHYHIHTKERSTRIVVFISIATMLLELYAGYTSHSKTLIMDGWHMLSHVLVLILAWGAYFYIRIKKDQITHKQQNRVISLTGFASAIVMLVITGVVIYESVEKFYERNVDVTASALAVAVIGLVVNGISAYFLHTEEEKRDVNIYAAYLHVVSDIIISLFAIIALAAAKYLDILILDSVLAFAGAIIILRWSVGLVWKTWKEVLELKNG